MAPEDMTDFQNTELKDEFQNVLRNSVYKC